MEATTVEKVNNDDDTAIAVAPTATNAAASGSPTTRRSPVKNLKTTSTDITRIEINTQSKLEDEPDVVEFTKTVIIKKNTIETTFENVPAELGASAGLVEDQLESLVDTATAAATTTKSAETDATLDDVKRKLEVIEFNFPEKTTHVKIAAPSDTAEKSDAKKGDAVDSSKQKKEKEKKKKEKKIKVKPEDAASVSCFSCKSRKARQEKEKQEAEAKKAAAATTAATTSGTQQPNLEVKIEVSKSKPIDTSLFQGLDNNVIIRTDDKPADQTTEVITITRVGDPSAQPEAVVEGEQEKQQEEQQQPQEEKQPVIVAEDVDDEAKKSAGGQQTISTVGSDSLKDANVIVTDAADGGLNIEFKTTSPSMIGSTSLEGGAIRSGAAGDDSSSPTTPDQASSSRPLSDDIVKLPTDYEQEPEQKLGEIVIAAAAATAPGEIKIDEVKISVAESKPATAEVEVKKKEEEKKKPEEKSSKKKEKKEKKAKKPISCFSTKKSKAEKTVDKEKSPTSKPTVDVAATTNSAAAKVETEPSKAVGGAATVDVILPPSDWAIGLDRAEEVAVVRKDPAIKVEESLSKKPVVVVVEKEPAAVVEVALKPIEIEIPSVIDAAPIRIEASLSKPSPKQLTIDSPGAYVKIDREPDHAVIPIVVQTTSPITPKVATVTTESKVVAAQTTTATAVDDNEKDGKKKKKKTAKKEEAKVKKTSAIDMPLIDILTPKPAAAATAVVVDEEKNKKKQAKKEKKSKAAKSSAEV